VRELQLGDAPLEVVVLPDAGGRLHRLRAFGHDLLRTPADRSEHLRDPFFWGAYVMAPWCGRIPAQPTAVAGRTVDVGSNFADGTAIHGQVYATPWAEMGRGALDVHGLANGWPWAYEAAMDVAVTGTTLSMALVLTNRSAEPMPAGIGLHPWWRRPLMVAVEASQVYPSNDSPPPRPLPVAGALDLRVLGTPADGLDATWTDLAEQRLKLEWPDLGIGARLSFSGTGDHVVVAAPPELDAIAVELQTHAPDGLRRLEEGLPGAMRLLAPDEELRLDLELELHRS
jgi:aldose 1-epimerase